jgi:hypothetical protein
MKNVTNRYVIEFFLVTCVVRVSEKFMAHFLEMKETTLASIIDKLFDIRETDSIAVEEASALNTFLVNTNRCLD